MAVGCDGTVYVADSNNNRIQCFDSNGNFIRKWGKKGTGDGEFNFPTGLALSEFIKSNNITKPIMDAMLMVPELASYPWRPFNSIHSGLSGLLFICIEYICNECIYIVDCGNHRIQVFDVSNLNASDKVKPDNVKFIRKWGSNGIDDGQFEYPWACAIDRRDLSGLNKDNKVNNKDNKVNMVYVTDTRNHRIQVFDSEGRFIRKWEYW